MMTNKQKRSFTDMKKPVLTDHIGSDFVILLELALAVSVIELDVTKRQQKAKSTALQKNMSPN